VAPHTAEDFPWQRPLGGEPPVDEFELLRRGKESSLAHRLTRSVFDARLRMAANNKAAGSDMFTNELLTLPVARYNMLGVARVTCYPALELQALPLTSEQRFVT